MDTLCMGCMNPLTEKAACPRCGYPANGQNPREFLQVGVVLSGRYMIGRVLSAGGENAIYIGYDQSEKAPIIVREYFPANLCRRGENGTLEPDDEKRAAYIQYLEAFLTHARTIARLRELPANIPIYDIFEENKTAYAVREWCEGQTLSAYLAAKGGHLTWDEARPLLIPLLTSLASFHAAGVLHLGLSPDNLILGSDNKLHITGFAIPQARTVTSELIPQLYPGFAAPEQYQSEREATAATDVYGVTAAIFTALSGNAPPDVPSRLNNSSELLMPASVAEALPEHVVHAVWSGLQLDPENRIHTVIDLRDKLSAAPAVTAMRNDDWPTSGGTPNAAVRDPEEDDEDRAGGHRGLYAFIIIILVVAFMVMAMGLILYKMFPEEVGGYLGLRTGTTAAPSTTTTAAETGLSTTTSTSAETEAGFPVSDVVGQNFYDIRSNLAGGREVQLAGLEYSNQPPGTILSQEPQAENAAPFGDPIRVIISAGSETAVIPNVLGWKEEDAVAFLEALGFRIESVVQVAVSLYERGLVDSVTPPVYSERLRGTKIVLRISDAEPTTTPPATTAITTTVPTPPPPTTPSEEETTPTETEVTDNE